MHTNPTKMASFIERTASSFGHEAFALCMFGSMCLPLPDSAWACLIVIQLMALAGVVWRLLSSRDKAA